MIEQVCLTPKVIPGKRSQPSSQSAEEIMKKQVFFKSFEMAPPTKLILILLAHAHTVCTRLSFPPTQLKTGKEQLGTRLELQSAR
jgi:hypothetical protein